MQKDDVIYRQAAIRECFKNGAPHIGHAISQLPSAQPTQANAEPMQAETLDCVRRQDVIKGLQMYSIGQTDVVNYYFLLVGYMIKLPPVQPGRKRGEWIRNDNGTYHCSVCQSWIPEEQHCYARYCLHCGADMRSEDNG